ncbi:hypothetical protein PAXRUDRAFT_169165 [Paxillus rubicundulus Ve08.2h10]|uniref:Uncharacterized protein n=1 Tax=Paxillus rubicundulus Ve08.2h10 TaxID=930991 RepID=A0A0D0D8G4_9AGAM|nr:hypothetical protein PAXRUDRAFT_169165 [Paxillus rubicundulus Ve08.2h10]
MSVSILTLESPSFRPCTILRGLSVRVSRCDGFPWFYPGAVPHQKSGEGRIQVCRAGYGY